MTMTAPESTAAPALTNPNQVDALTWDREPHPSWQEALDRITPPNRAEHRARAVIWWEPGDTWEPIQRWIIYQLLPKRVIPPSIRAELEGPHPRSKGRYSATLGQWVDGPAPNITRTAWEIYQRFGGWAQPYWVLQGEGGGHRYALFRYEQVLLEHVTGRKDVAAPGDLPHCEPDQRTWDALWEAKQRTDEVQKLALLATKYRGKLDGEDEVMVEKVARQVVASWGEKVGQHADELAWALRRNSSIVRGDGKSTLDDGQVDEEIVNELIYDMTGNVPGGNGNL